MAELTIIMPTWNKEAYVGAALDSIFAQRTNRPFRILVADDCSTDGTLAVVARYAEAHPGVIEVLPSERNQKLFRNIVRAYAICRTPYFCVLDPDDFWTDEGHVERALSFLEAHPDYTIYTSDTVREEPDGTRSGFGYPTEPVESDFTDYLAGRAVLGFTTTSVYRNVVFAKGLPARVASPDSLSMERTMRGDSFRNFLHLREGKAHYEPRVEACYRITAEGIYQGLPVFERDVMNARFFLEMWRFDEGRSPELLLRSYRFFRSVDKSAYASLTAADFPETRLLPVLKELADLAAAYDGNREALDAAIGASLPWRHRLRFLAYRKLRRKNLI